MASIPDPFPKTLYRDDPTVPEGYTMLVVGNQKQLDEKLKAPNLEGWRLELGHRDYPRIMYIADAGRPDGVKTELVYDKAQENHAKDQGYQREPIAPKAVAGPVPVHTNSEGLPGRVTALEARVAQLEDLLFNSTPVPVVDEPPPALTGKAKK